MIPRGRKVPMMPCFGSVEIALCLWIACAVLTLVASQQKFYIQGRYGKRQEPRADSFIVSEGRHGRNENSQRDKKSLAKLMEIMPRSIMYRAYWGRRYGKLSLSNHRTVPSADRLSVVLSFADRVDPYRKGDAGNGNDLRILF